jgi:hypothetical protein
MTQRPLFDDVVPKSLPPTPDPAGMTCPTCGRVLMRSLEGTWCERCPTQKPQEAPGA